MVVKMKNNKVEPVLVSYLLEKGEISLPMSLMRHETIIDFEESLRKERPLFLSKTFKKISENIERDFLKGESLDEFINMAKQLKKKNFFITEDDEKIIDYLVSLEKLRWDFLLETIGPLYFLLKTFEETEKISLLSKFIQTFIIINSYVMLYELILHEVDRRLYHNLKLKKQKEYPRFFRIKRQEYNEHATAGIINEVLSDLINLPKDNNSIFGGQSESRIFRNKAAHANIFYDEYKDEIIIAGRRYSLDEFLKLFFRLFSFLIAWIEKITRREVEDSVYFKKKIISDLRKSLNELFTAFLKIERAGELRIRFVNLIISWKREVELL